MSFVYFSPSSPSGKAAKLQAIAIVTAGIDSLALQEQEIRNAIGLKPDAEQWALLTIALSQFGTQMTAFAASMDAENQKVVDNQREQFTAYDLLQNWAADVHSGKTDPES